MSDTRTPLIAGNWKMFKTQREAVDLIQKISYKMPATGGTEVCVCPPFTALRSVSLVLETDNVPVSLGAQNLYWEDEGAFTGEVSGPMLVDLACKYVIIGHSERRQFFGDTDETVNRKIAAALRHGLVPIFCVGETLEQRESGVTQEWISGQVRSGLSGIQLSTPDKLVVAYEPIWAIGTGRNATPQDANEVNRSIRETLAEVYDPETADGIRILYGGSVKPDNVISLMIEPHVDGALVGGASLEADSFLRLCNYKTAGL